MEAGSAHSPGRKSNEMKYLVEITFRIGNQTMSKAFTGSKSRDAKKEARDFVSDLSKKISDIQIIDLRTQKL